MQFTIQTHNKSRLQIYYPKPETTMIGKEDKRRKTKDKRRKAKEKRKKKKDKRQKIYTPLA